MQGWGVFEKWCVKVASDAGGNETASLGRPNFRDFPGQNWL